jgi:hypothetical protein
MSRYRTQKEFLQAFKRFNSLASKKFGWHTGVSAKEHTCEFGHPIPPESLYFKKLLDSDGEQKLRVCPNCMEQMVFLTVDVDATAREVTDQIYHQTNPRTPKVKDMLTH